MRPEPFSPRVTGPARRCRSCLPWPVRETSRGSLKDDVRIGDVVVATRVAVHFKPIAAGEVVLDSRDSALALRLRSTISDAAAIDLESAGVWFRGQSRRQLQRSRA
jgi:hypothetical protein